MGARTLDNSPSCHIILSNQTGGATIRPRLAVNLREAGRLPAGAFRRIARVRRWRGARWAFGASLGILILTIALAVAIVPNLGDNGGEVGATSTSNGNGTANGTGTVLGTPVSLALTYNVEMKGDYLAAGYGMRGSGPPGSGTITMPALPGGASVVKAFLYWAVMEVSPPPGSLAMGTLNTNPIVGTLIGTTADPCWDLLSPPANYDIHNYVADVTGFEITGGANALTGFASGGPPGDGTSPPILEGATLVVVYSDATAPNKRIQIHEGAVTFVGPPAEATVFSGWTAVAGTTQTTYIVADGQQGGTFPAPNNRTKVDGTTLTDPALNGFGPGSQYWDTKTENISAFVPPADTSVSVEVESKTTDCITWVAQVLSVPVAEPTPTPTPTPPPPTPTPTPTPVPVGGIVDVLTSDEVDAPIESTTSGDGGPGDMFIVVLASLPVVAAASYGLLRLRRR
jgi:hypothetical protein